MIVISNVTYGEKCSHCGDQNVHRPCVVSRKGPNAARICETCVSFAAAQLRFERERTVAEGMKFFDEMAKSTKTKKTKKKGPRGSSV